MNLKIKKLNPAATLPSYAREGDAGLDLFAVKAMVIEPGKSALVIWKPPWRPFARGEKSVTATVERRTSP